LADFFGQLAAEAVQQADLLAQHFFVIGQVFVIGQFLVTGQFFVIGHLPVELQPANPKEAMKATARRVRMDFIRP